MYTRKGAVCGMAKIGGLQKSKIPRLRLALRVRLRATHFAANPQTMQASFGEPQPLRMTPDKTATSSLTSTPRSRGYASPYGFDSGVPPSLRMTPDKTATYSRKMIVSRREGAPSLLGGRCYVLRLRSFATLKDDSRGGIQSRNGLK